MGLPLYQYIGGCNAKTLPVPMMNILNGGQHADNNVDIQEFMIMPSVQRPCRGTESRGRGFSQLERSSPAKGLTPLLATRRLAPNLKSNEEAIAVIIEAIGAAGYEPGKDVMIALDVASTELFKDGLYHFDGEGVVRTLIR